MIDDTLGERGQERPEAKSLAKGDLVELVEQLASLTRAGVPLPSGLRASAEELISPSLRASFLHTADLLERGVNLETALASSGGRLSPELQGLIDAGSRSGRLADLLTEFVRSANLGRELRQMFWGTLVYPTLILLVLLVVVQVVCRIADESFFGIFQDFGVERTGGMVGLLIAVATFIATYGIWLTLGLILVPVVIWLLMRVLVRPARRRQLFCRIPLVGPIARYSSLTEFCHRLAMLLEAEVPLPLAFKLAGSSVADAGVAEACERMGQAVASGEPLWKAVRLWRSIPAGLGQLFRWSEERRNLPRALHMAGEMFEARARSQSSFARSVLATILFLTIIWWICFAFLVLFMPLLSTFRFLSG